MNRADLMHSVLKDGTWHTRRDVFERVGFMLTNNAASELRARGFDVEQRLFRGNYEYRLSQIRGEHPSSLPQLAPVLPSTGGPSDDGSRTRAQSSPCEKAACELPKSSPVGISEQLTLAAA